jgi:molybdopterin-guanine dinucleotide biosynthesis protein A
MGRAKALLPWRGRPLIAHMVDRLHEVADEVLVVTSRALGLPELPARVVVDRAPDLGPLGGIREALHAIGSDRAFVTSTDTPFIDPSFVRELLGHEGTVACAVDGRVQPFPALYARALAATADALIDERRMRPLHLLEAGDFRRLDGAAWAEVGVFSGFNTPDDYLDAVTRDGQDAPVVIELFGTARQTAGQAEVRTGAGTLRAVLGALEPDLVLCRDDAVSPHVLVSLNGEQYVDDPALPVGPGERILILEACAGG